jgi:RimJ/RimL family protein N-acetyltransferase
MKNERITIRSAIEKDIDVLCSWWADGKVMAHAGFPNGLETDKVKLLDRIVKQNREEYPNHQLLMIEIDGFKPIGEMNYRLVEEDVFEIGIKICDFNEHSKGYGKVAIELLLEYLKTYKNAKKIVLDTNLKNTKAQRFYKQLGFEEVRVEKDSWKDQLGVLQGAVHFEKELF